MLARECERIERDLSEIATMVNGSVVGVSPTTSLTAFLDFAGTCSDLGFTDLTVHYPRKDGIFAGNRSEFARIITEALPIVHGF